MNYDNILYGYLNYSKLKDLSKVYLAPCKIFLKFCEKNNIDIINITVPVLSDFILSLKETKQNGTVNNYIKAIKSLYCYLDDYGYLPSGNSSREEVKKIKLLRTEFKIKDCLTIKDIDLIIKKASLHKIEFSPSKLKVILYFMFYTGVRKRELSNLKREDIDLEEETAKIRVPTKNRHERLVFFPPRVREMLRKFFETEKEEINAFNLTYNKISTLFAFLRNFDRNISPHKLRHSYTQMLASLGIDIRVAQQLLGHKSIQSTLIYYNPNIETVKKIYRERIQ